MCTTRATRPVLVATPLPCFCTFTQLPLLNVPFQIKLWPGYARAIPSGHSVNDTLLNLHARTSRATDGSDNDFEDAPEGDAAEAAKLRCGFVCVDRMTRQSAFYLSGMYRMLKLYCLWVEQHGAWVPYAAQAHDRVVRRNWVRLANWLVGPSWDIRARLGWRDLEVSVDHPESDS